MSTQSSQGAFSLLRRIKQIKLLNRFNKLWHRVFAYTLLLVVLSQLAVFVLFFFTQDREYRLKWLEDYVGSLAATLTEQDVGAANIFLQHINRRELHMWIERADGTLFSGVPRPGFSFAERQDFKYPVIQRGAVTIIDTEIEGRTTFCLAPVFFTTESGILCYAFTGYSSSTPIQDIFYQGLLALFIVGGLMSFWIARSVAFPLHSLRNEALEIAGNNLEKRITVQGYDEITDVADAVNKLTENLVKHILGMQTLLANISHELRSPLTRMELYATMLEEGVAELEDRLATLLRLPVESSGSGSGVPSGISLETSIKNSGESAGESLGTSPLSDPLSRGAMSMTNLRHLKQELAHLEGLIGTSLLLSKLNLQADSDSFEPVSFSELCAEMLRRYTAVFTVRGLKVDQEIVPELWLSGEETLLCHMLSNLLDNAAKYTTPQYTPGDTSGCAPGCVARCAAGGQVRVTVHQQNRQTVAKLPGSADAGLGQRIILRLENTHAHLSAEVRESLFTPFYRAGIATGDGVGLGLSLVRKIAALHGGTVKVENTRLENSEAVRIEVSISLMEPKMK